MATRSSIATDDFSGTLGNFTEKNSGWNSVSISSGKITSAFSGNPSAGTEAATMWTGAGSFTNDQYASIVISSANNSNDRVGVTARMNGSSGGSRSYYMAYMAGDGIGTNHPVIVAKCVAGTYSVVSGGSGTNANFPDGAVLALEVEGTALRCYVDSTLVYDLTDTSLSTGTPGIVIAYSSNVARGDDWVGGNLTSSSITGRSLLLGVG